MHFVVYDVLDSTNAEARRLLDDGALPLPACILAREQTAGRGTRGRTWCSPRDAGIYLSVVDRPVHAAGPATVLCTLAAGVACAEAIEEVTGVRVELRPVNDFWVGGRKLGGVLMEVVAEAGVVTSIVTGVGINVRSVGRTVTTGAAEPVSLEEILRPDAFAALDTGVLVDRIARGLPAWIAAAGREERERIRQAWAARRVAGAEVPGGV